MGVIEIFVLNLVAILIGLSKAGFGGGTGVLTGPLLLLVMPAKKAIGLMLPLLLACDILSLYPYWRKWDKANVLALMPGAFVGICLGDAVLGVISDAALKKTIGFLACLFAALQVVRDEILKSPTPFQCRLWHGTLVGLLTGLVSTIAHVGGLLTTMYLLPQRLSNQAFVGTTTLVYFLINTAKLVPYVRRELVNIEVLRQDVWLLPALILGTAAGVYLNRRIPSATFSKVVLLLVLAMGVKLLIEPK